nr:ORF3 [Raccoon dog Torque teno virus 2]
MVLGKRNFRLLYFQINGRHYLSESRSIYLVVYISARRWDARPISEQKRITGITKSLDTGSYATIWKYYFTTNDRGTPKTTGNS